ncbi:histidine phosphatase family protein [Sphingomonas sp. S1-29]|uniref:phosphoglycerate mutase family protein n=1 Tax=Sphingomonas sp. S1-29 TaxID=2991074 RepID=UPI00223F559D|nr:phosphoglycerate mutase family protein [Sphingomonas sp. S1-29]UZK69885.1 histidine phosphatase family protein [Sphingomonas sp. S1-29]
MKRRAVLVALGLLLAGCAGGGGAQTVHVVRHFDTPKGVQDAELTAQGQARAEALVRWFAGKPLDAIFVTPFRRSRQTIAPLAAAQGIVPVVYDWEQQAAAVARIRAGGGAVLVVGHSNTVPDLVEALGGVRPPDMVHEDFGGIWTVGAGETVKGVVE